MKQQFILTVIMLITVSTKLNMLVFRCVVIIHIHPICGAFSFAQFLIVKVTHLKQVLGFTLPCQVSFMITYLSADINPLAFSGAPSVYSVKYTDWSETESDLLGTIECLTQNSPPTSVTWLRDGIPVEVDGVGLEMIQTVVERWSYSRYNNTLLVRNAAQLAGNHTYNCTVTNAAGTNTNWVNTTLTGFLNQPKVCKKCFTFQFPPSPAYSGNVNGRRSYKPAIL